MNLRYQFYMLLWRWRNFRHPPRVVISCGGERTVRPKVHVSVASIYGMQGVYTWDNDEQGNACATLHAKGLAKITQRKLVDCRTNPPTILSTS